MVLYFLIYFSTRHWLWEEEDFKTKKNKAKNLLKWLNRSNGGVRGAETVWKQPAAPHVAVAMRRGPGILHIAFTPIIIIIIITELYISAFLRIRWRILRLTQCPWSLEGMLNYGWGGGVWARQLKVRRLLPQTFTPSGVMRRASLFTRSEARVQAQPLSRPLASDVDSSTSARTLSAARSGANPLTYRRCGALPANPGMQTPLELTCGSNTSEVMEQSSFLPDVGSFSSVRGPFYIELKSLGCHFAQLPNFQF